MIVLLSKWVAGRMFTGGLLQFLLLFSMNLQLSAQPPCKSLDTMLVRLTIVTQSMPVSLKMAAEKYPGETSKLFDTISALFTSGAKELADLADRRSPILNMYAGFEENQTLPFSPMPGDQKIEDFFLRQANKTEALDRSMNAYLKRLDKGHYRRLGYVGAYDSAYKKRLPQLNKYSAEVIAQVQEEIRFLKANQYLLKNKDEHVRVKYLEKYLSVLGRLLNLSTTLWQVLIKDGAAVYTYCQEYPATCEKYVQ